jgi:hypothetical protein
MTTLLLCDNKATSDEHTGPKYLFSKKCDLPAGTNLRRNFKFRAVIQSTKPRTIEHSCLNQVIFNEKRTPTNDAAGMITDLIFNGSKIDKTNVKPKGLKP